MMMQLFYFSPPLVPYLLTLECIVLKRNNYIHNSQVWHFLIVHEFSGPQAINSKLQSFNE